MAMAGNLDSMGKTNEALAMYQQIALGLTPNSYTAPLAMLSQVYILKAKNRNDDARRICENHPHPIPNEFLGRRGDAATAPAEADYHIDAATGGGAKRPANVGNSCRASAAKLARPNQQQTAPSPKKP